MDVEIMMNEQEVNFLTKMEELATAFKTLTGSSDMVNYGRLTEVKTSILLGLDWNSGFKSKDATDKNGAPVELKSTTQSRLNGTYNGLSVFENRDDFVEELHNKFPDNTRHIFTRYEGSELIEAYEMENSDVLDILISKTAKDWIEGKHSPVTKHGTLRKDTRAGAKVSMTEIKRLGKQIELHRQ